MVYGAMARLVDELESQAATVDMVTWACPVPFFGEITRSPVATVGINPSNKEFVDSGGDELTGAQRRLPTLLSMGLSRWSETSGDDVRHIVRSCERYFDGNPYRTWFDVLERMLKVGGTSFYGGIRACHIDLVAYATSSKWGSLPGPLRRDLIDQGRTTLAELIRDSAIQVLVLNGRSVVSEFVSFAQAELEARPVPEWTLPRSRGAGVAGVAYEGTIRTVGGVDLDREVLVIGYNHNLQSSFGVTSQVMQRIGQHVGETIAQATAR